MIVDVNAVTFDTGVNSFPNRRTDTRTGPNPLVAGGGVLRVSVPEAVGGKTVVGQLTVDRAVDAGFVTAYGCDGRHSRRIQTAPSADPTSTTTERSRRWRRTG